MGSFDSKVSEGGGLFALPLMVKNSPYFNLGKCLRQGDPLSPLLFNLVLDVFIRMLMKTASKNYISGFMNSIHPEGILRLQYVDDIPMFPRHNFVDATHLEWIMICFEQISRMKINYGKSDIWFL
jgi:hypothetical protein